MTEDWTREKILQLGSAFWANKILLTAAELNLFSKFDKGPKTVDDLCQSEGWSPRGLTILLDALAAMGLLSKSPYDRYSTPKSLVNLLADDGRDSVLPMLLHMAHLWKSWTDLPEIVRGEKSSYGAGSHKWSDKEIDAFIGAMDVIARNVAIPIIGDLVDVDRFERLLDIGGGPGTYTAAFLSKNPKMTATIFDRPNVIEIAKRRLKEKGLISRVQFVEGDFNSDPLPNGHDLVWGSAVIHSNSRDQNRKLFKKVYAALSTGGRFLLRDHFLDKTRTEPVEGALFAVNMLAVTEAGNCYTFDEVKEDLVAAGFHDVQIARQGSRMDQIVSGVK
ncbi:MAG: acetylserotonin O-methyltransferase [Deltaproteobacteria bacterium]|nr:acetylserotonin O-methyltransferase [Deltaproteobacteria bacterium]